MSTSSASTSSVTEHHSEATDVVNDAQAAQNAWKEEQTSPLTPSSHPQTHDASTATLSSEPKPSSLSPNTVPTVPDQDDDFGAFQSASTDPFKQPIYTQHQVDETENLLNAESNPDIQVGVFVGTGLVEPLRAGLDKRTRALRRLMRTL
ncbi:uncharacterized protein K460DRAFT_354797 [Cucurbitaria berberidis CBS 394.84]|uniref:Uncharacterized protein n=1 Tax=Cucurbitaria berberidis CBS 394.84 TaxID=1168544 RepID=A0A9P4GG42_9PLEO|nr:uncharacterized protein K460DRAFT_354797 [Cucurbitaria berberidis CBS 394.84]KAF1844935.1 hypothetical protein K460DRAFT_354797 [Cucurbitaria berberidis CBS 394.84]